MGRSVIGICATLGMFIGSYVPVVWGASAFSVTSLVFGAAGGLAGVWLGMKIAEG